VDLLIDNDDLHLILPDVRVAKIHIVFGDWGRKSGCKMQMKKRTMMMMDFEVKGNSQGFKISEPRVMLIHCFSCGSIILSLGEEEFNRNILIILFLKLCKSLIFLQLFL